MDQGLESLPMSENADRVVMLGDGIAQRMYPTKDGKITCDPICHISSAENENNNSLHFVAPQ